MNNLIHILQMTADRAHAMATEQSVADAPIQIGDVTVIPVSKVSCGFSFGGSNATSRKAEGKTTAGAGAKVTKTPLSFITVVDGQLHILRVEDDGKNTNIVAKLKPMIETIKEKKAAKKAEKDAAL
ncbi:MAG: hypothetical protein E7467_02345 [Ruminococcaceae bacterium]|nr:hypothetical protein [Oscillospiraceae bacterium]